MSNQIEYTTIATGIKVEIKRINYVKVWEISNAAEAEARAQGEPIDPPTYLVSVGEDEQEHEHIHEVEYDDDGQEKIIQSTLDTDEDREKWEAYLLARRRMVSLTNERVTRFALRTGVVVKPHKGWEAEQLDDGLQIPTKPRDKYLHYLNTEVFPELIERDAVAQSIIELSTPKFETETREAVKKFFRRQVEEKAD